MTTAVYKTNAGAIKQVNTGKSTLLNTLKNYILDNSKYFAASSAMTSGNVSAAVQIMKR